MAEDDTTPPVDTPEEPKAKWEKREFAINGNMRKICEIGITSTEAQIESLKRKLRKLQYGG